jgi:membrane-bound ClpP family serine protease
MPDLTTTDDRSQRDPVDAARHATQDEPAATLPQEAQPIPPRQPVVSWIEFVMSATPAQVEQRFSEEIRAILSSPEVEDYVCLGLLEPDDMITQFDLDQVFRSLSLLNPNRTKNVLLILLSRGGSIEPAYQISKVCKASARERFVVCVPRQAKSAATLIALGADEIHMSVLGQLGPIDPQLGGLPALGVSQALETIATLVEKHPGSAEMFARYLRLALTVEQIGYYGRISESAEQYAVRLLSTKVHIREKAAAIAHELVHEYKDHAFVIDLEEAQMHLGSGWIKSATAEVDIAERVYELFYSVNLFLGLYKKKKLLVLGSFDQNLYIFDKGQAA